MRREKNYIQEKAKSPYGNEKAKENGNFVNFKFFLSFFPPKKKKKKFFLFC